MLMLAAGCVVLLFLLAGSGNALNVIFIGTKQTNKQTTDPPREHELMTIFLFLYRIEKDKIEKYNISKLYYIL